MRKTDIDKVVNKCFVSHPRFVTAHLKAIQTQALLITTTSPLPTSNQVPVVLSRLIKPPCALAVRTQSTMLDMISDFSPLVGALAYLCGWEQHKQRKQSTRIKVLIICFVIVVLLLFSSAERGYRCVIVDTATTTQNKAKTTTTKVIFSHTG